MKKYSEEKVGFHIEEDKLALYLRERGLEIVDYLNNSAMEKRFLANKDSLATARVTAWFRFVMAKTQPVNDCRQTHM